MRARLVRLAQSRFGTRSLALTVPPIVAVLWWLTPPIVAVVVPISAAGIASIAVTRVIATYPDDPTLSNRIARWALGAFALHLMIGLAISASYRLTTYLGGDALQYHLWAKAIIGHWFNGGPLPVDLPIGKQGFPYLIAVLYVVFGPYQVVGIALNAFLGATVVVLMTDTTRRLYGDRAAWWVPPLVVLPIGMLLWMSQMLREAPVMVLVAAGLNAAVRLEKSTRILPLAVIAGSVAILFTVRNYMAVTLGLGLLLGLALGRRGVGGVGAAAAAVGVVALVVLGLGVGFSGLRAVQDQADFARLNNIRLGSATGAASGYLPDADISTGLRAAAYLPIALPRFFLGPFPWEIRGGRQVLALPDVLVWWVLLPSLWRGTKRAWRRTRRGLFVMVMPAAGATVVLALLIANYGTVVRSRLQVFLLLIPLIALGLEQRRSLQNDVHGAFGGRRRLEPIPSSR